MSVGPLKPRDVQYIMERDPVLISLGYAYSIAMREGDTEAAGALYDIISARINRQIASMKRAIEEAFAPR